MRIFNSLIVPKNLKEGTVAKYQKKMKRGPFETKKSHKAEKREESHSVEKVGTFCFGKLVKKLAHTHGFEHEPSG